MSQLRIRKIQQKAKIVVVSSVASAILLIFATGSRLLNAWPAAPNTTNTPALWGYKLALTAASYKVHEVECLYPMYDHMEKSWLTEAKDAQNTRYFLANKDFLKRRWREVINTTSRENSIACRRDKFSLFYFLRSIPCSGDYCPNTVLWTEVLSGEVSQQETVAEPTLTDTKDEGASIPALVEEGSSPKNQSEDLLESAPDSNLSETGNVSGTEIDDRETSGSNLIEDLQSGNKSSDLGTNQSKLSDVETLSETQTDDQGHTLIEDMQSGNNSADTGNSQSDLSEPAGDSSGNSSRMPVVEEDLKMENHVNEEETDKSNAPGVDPIENKIPVEFPIGILTIIIILFILCLLSPICWTDRSLDNQNNQLGEEINGKRQSTYESESDFSNDEFDNSVSLHDSRFPSANNIHHEKSPNGVLEKAKGFRRKVPRRKATRSPNIGILRALSERSISPNRISRLFQLPVKSVKKRLRMRGQETNVPENQISDEYLRRLIGDVRSQHPKASTDLIHYHLRFDEEVTVERTRVRRILRHSVEPHNCLLNRWFSTISFNFFFYLRLFVLLCCCLLFVVLQYCGI